MAKQITQVGVLKNVLTGTELVEIQEASGGFGSSKRTTVQAIADLVSAGIPVAPVQSVQGRFGNVVINAEDIGLENADNTSDLDKPVSTATQNELDLKANIAGQEFTGAVDAPVLTQAGVQVITVATYNSYFDDRLSQVLSSTTQLPEGDNLYYTQDRVDTRVGELLPSTDSLPQGVVNRYFNGINLFNQIVTGTGIFKTYDSVTGLVYLFSTGTPTEPAVAMVNGKQGIVELTTEDIPEEGDNLYWSDLRFEEALGNSYASKGQIEVVFDSGNSVLDSNYTFTLRIPYSADITKVSIHADPIGSVELDIRKCTFADLPASIGDSILPANIVIVQDKTEITDLSAWETHIVEGEYVTVCVTQVADTVSYLMVVLETGKVN